MSWEIFWCYLDRAARIGALCQRNLGKGCSKTSLFPWRGDGASSCQSKAALTSQNQSKGQVKNSVGAGDSMVAGFTGETLATTGDVIEAFKWGWL